jgi:hypothetical protein
MPGPFMHWGPLSLSPTPLISCYLKNQTRLSNPDQLSLRDLSQQCCGLRACLTFRAFLNTSGRRRLQREHLRLDFRASRSKGSYAVEGGIVRVRTPRREKGLGALEPIFLAAWLLRELYPRKRTFVSGSGANRVYSPFVHRTSSNVCRACCR